jgi:hypothetical protein
MNHDIIGIKELLEVQRNHLNKIKFHNRIQNEKYLREHPEIEFILKNFLMKILEDRPVNSIQYAGEFFNKMDLKKLYEKEVDKEKQENK